MVSMIGRVEMTSDKFQSALHFDRTRAIDPEAAWRQVCERETGAAFFYAVTTTGVFCRPGCASRRPLRENVRFFRSIAEAQAAGFRPCKRCKPEGTAAGGPLDRIRAHIEAHLDRPVPLAELGRLVGLSPFTVQRLFKQHLGVSPLA
jgi:AraC family transcriptional regulator of adaptative response/methylated-DNA-[protein]-cysteine methyltransferase